MGEGQGHIPLGIQLILWFWSQLFFHRAEEQLPTGPGLLVDQITYPKKWEQQMTLEANHQNLWGKIHFQISLCVLRLVNFQNLKLVPTEY